MVVVRNDDVRVEIINAQIVFPFRLENQAHQLKFCVARARGTRQGGHGFFGFVVVLGNRR